MRLFWTRAETDEAAGSSWLLPFGDMMSLLLAVFVMIAAMSELRRDDRFDKVGSAVRSGFGFSTGGSPTRAKDSPPWSSTFVERLEKAGVISSGLQGTGAVDLELAACCQVTTSTDRIVVRVDGAAAFERFGAQLTPKTRQLFGRIAEALADGQTHLEIRGHAGDGLLPPHAGFRDAMDLSYARARAVADLLIESGIASGRILITACGDRALPLMEGQENDPALRPGIEIIVHTREPHMHALNIAEKERAENG
ncbi:MAG: OmpA/MotB family protein [Phycisphaerae bacterium]